MTDWMNKEWRDWGNTGIKDNGNKGLRIERMKSKGNKGLKEWGEGTLYKLRNGLIKL